MKCPKKIRAGALQFVLFIGAVVAILLMGFVLISHSHTFFGKRTDITVSVIQRADFGLRYAFQKGMEDSSVLEVPLEEKFGIETRVEKEHWGLFEKYTSKAQHKNTEFTKTALVGNGTGNGSPALYLTDRQRPLIIAGSAKITGDAYLPSQGIRMGNISGNSYRYGRLLHGDRKESGPEIPEMAAETKRGITDLLENFQGKGNAVMFERDLKVRNSFLSPTKHINGRTLRLEGASLIGNIIIAASEKIIVGPSATLRDVILIAPEIVIEDGVKGSFQAFADTYISVGKRCELSYPTALVVSERNRGTGQGKGIGPNLHVDSGSAVNGVLAYLDGSEKQTYFPQIMVSEGATVRGEIYCTENLELKGSVIGSVVTNGFIALENGSIYQNHLYNGTIDGNALPKEYVGLVAGKERTKKVVKWLY
ncbi:hypothetical protein [Pricia sp.]|uniref:hypothetical protein n=1 Tax=Pricia sp. TaxID=2268138 RepID=UPI00359428E6